MESQQAAADVVMIVTDFVTKAPKLITPLAIVSKVLDLECSFATAKRLVERVDNGRHLLNQQIKASKSKKKSSFLTCYLTVHQKSDRTDASCVPAD